MDGTAALLLAMAHRDEPVLIKYFISLIVLTCAWSIRRKLAAGKARAEQESPCAPPAKQSPCPQPLPGFRYSSCSGSHPWAGVGGQLNPVSSLPPT